MRKTIIWITTFQVTKRPLRYLKSGDPYYCFSHKTARLVAEKLKLKKNEYDLAFQSRFGREEWLKPYIEDIIESYKEKGIKSLQTFNTFFLIAFNNIFNIGF